MKSSLSPKNGYAFGFRWSLVGCALALVYTTSCELIIPPDRSVPRYNTVHGAKKRPLLNPGGSGYSGNTSLSSRSNAIDYVYGQPRVAGNAAPSTSAANAAPLPEAPVAAPVAEAPKPAPAPAPRVASASEDKSFWDRMAFWRDDTSVKEVPKAARVRPVENQNIGSASASAPVPTVVAAGELAPLPGSTNSTPITSPTSAPTTASSTAAQTGEYPSLHSAPARPSYAAVDNSKQRALSVRGELEADRTTAMQSREQLVRDAAAEPSLLANPPKLAAPAGALPPPPPMNAAQAKAVQAAASQPAAAVPAPAAAPASPINNGSSAFERLTQRPLTAPTAAPQMATAPAPAAAIEPIRLTPPAAEPASPAPVSNVPFASVPFASVNVSAPPAVSGTAAAPSATAMEPIRLTPPSAMANATTSAGTQTANLEPIRLTPPSGAFAGTSGGLPSTQAITEEGLQTSGTHQPYTPSYLPASRYGERRR